MVGRRAAHARRRGKGRSCLGLRVERWQRKYRPRLSEPRPRRHLRAAWPKVQGWSELLNLPDARTTVRPGVESPIWGGVMRFRWSLGAWTSILILAIAAAVLATPAGARQRDEGGSFHHAVYLETNAPSGNTVVVFDRHKDGTITQGQVVATGGLGGAAQQPFGFPIVDSQGAVTSNNSGSLIFAVNAGDNTISSFRATPHGLVLADRASSGGTLPVSVTTHGNLLYVLNEVSGSIFGLHFDGAGHLQPIGGSWR